MRQNLSVIAAILVLFLSRLGLGIWLDPGRSSGTVDDAVARLDQVPLTAGPWQGQDLAPMDPAEAAQAKLSGYVRRSYLNSETGDSVSVLLVCGRPGPISVHTPDACYGGAGYEMIGAPDPCPIAGESATFWTARFRKSAAPVPADLRIYWSWNATGSWEAAASPRLAFAGVPALYKLYVVCDAGSPDAPPAREPGKEFLGRFLPELQKALSPGTVSKRN